MIAISPSVGMLILLGLAVLVTAVALFWPTSVDDDDWSDGD